MRYRRTPDLRALRAPREPDVYCIDDHLQWAAATLAVEARRTPDERMAQSLWGACASIIVIARVLAQLDALDLSDEQELARLLPQICDDLGACFADGAPALASFGAADASPPPAVAAAGAVTNGLVVSAPRQSGVWKRRPLCLRLDRDELGAARLTVTGARNYGGRRAVSAGVDLLRAFVARLSGSRDLNALRPGVSISVLLG